MGVGLNHYADRIDLDSKTLRLINGGRLECRAPPIFDHFAYGAGAFNSHVPQNWVTTETGTGTPFAPGASGITVATGASGGVTNNAEELAGKNVCWNPSTMGDKVHLVCEARFKAVGTTTATAGDFYFGLADAVTYTSSLPYVVSAASALTTSVPTEFVGFAYSSIPTSGALYSASGNLIGAVTTISNADTVSASTKVKDSNYHIYRVEIDSVGNAHFYYDDENVMNVAAAVTANTALTPYLVAIAKDSKVHTITLDYLYVGGDIS